MARILYTVNIPRFFVSHRLPLALAASAAGHDVHVATANTDPVNLARIRDAGLTLHPIPLEQHGTSPLGELRSLIAIVRLYRRLRPELLHHVTIKPVLYGGIAARLAGSPPVVAAMSGLGRAFRGEDGGAADLRGPLRAALRFALPNRTTHALFQNVEDRDAFVQLGLAELDRTTVIRGSGVDPHVFTVAPEAAGRPTVLYAGRLMRQKGLERFVALARSLGEQARFVVAGYPEPSSPDVVPIATVEAWAEEGIIAWLGARDDMPAVYAAASIVVLPTIYGEGVPKTLIEAASCGRAIVTTDIPGCRDVCRDGENGLLVAPYDDEALRAAVLRLVGDRDLRARMGAAGRRLVEEEFSLEHVTSATLALYADLLASR